MTRRLLLSLLVLGLLIAGCGDDDTAEPPATTATSPPTSPPTTDSVAPTVAPTTEAPTTTGAPATSSTTTAPTTSAAPTAVCPGSGALPDQAENHGLAGGDVNGDGEIDTLHAYTIGDPGLPGAWWIQVSFANGGGSTLQVLDDSTGLSGVRIFDGFDLDGSGTDEIFAKVGAGASAEIFGIFQVIDCELLRVTLDGEPFGFLTGASINFLNGVECIDLDLNGANDFLVVYSGNRLGDSGEFEITAAQYALQDGALELILADGIGGNESDPGFSKFSSVTCPGLTLS